MAVEGRVPCIMFFIWLDGFTFIVQLRLKRDLKQLALKFCLALGVLPVEDLLCYLTTFLGSLLCC